MNPIVLTVISLVLPLLQAAKPPAPAAPAPEQLGVHSVFDFVVKGGPTMILIALLSIVALAIVVERLLFLRASRVIPPGFVDGLRGRLADRRAALEYCRADPSPIAAVLCAAVKNTDAPREVQEKRVEDAAHRQLTRLRKYLRVMSVLPQVSTMLGLLGTVFGMIKTFQAVAASSEALGKTELLARGIYEAWTATAGGILVAIPVMIAYHVLMGKVDARTTEIERIATEWLENGGLPEEPPPAGSRRSAVLIEPAVESGPIAVAPA